MAYINTDTNEYPITEREIRKANNNMSFPTPFTAPEPYQWVLPTTRPETTIYQVAKEVAPLLVGDQYEQQWEAVDAFEDIPGGPTKAEQEADYLQKVKNQNKAVAAAEQNEAIKKLTENATRVSLDLPPTLDAASEQSLKDYTKTVQADIDNPPGEKAYNPPLPPGVTPPAVSSITIKVTRVPGWNNALGWRADLIAGEENYAPANLAIAEYTNPNCDGYLYTTGAFQQDANGYFAICPPGQEKGDVDINLGLLFGAAKLSCFTVPAGTQEQTVYAYEAP